MSLIFRVIITSFCILMILVTIGFVGFQVMPNSFPPHREKTPYLQTVELPSNLPEPVYRHFAATLGNQIPEIESAVVTGRARFRISGLWMPVRFKAYYTPGKDFYRYMEITWFGIPLLKGRDSYINEEGSLRIEGVLSISERGDRINQGQNLAMWAEAVFMPSVFVTDPRVRWEAVNDTTARLVVPFGGCVDNLLVEFDPQTGLMTQMSAQRYRDKEEMKTPWRVEFQKWDTLHSAKVPVQSALTWEDEGGPWAFFTIESVEYNVDVSEEIATAGALSQDDDSNRNPKSPV